MGKCGIKMPLEVALIAAKRLGNKCKMQMETVSRGTQLVVGCKSIANWLDRIQEYYPYLFQKKEQDPKAEALADPVDEIGYGKPQLSQCCILYPPCLFSSRVCGFSSRGEFTRKTLVENLRQDQLR